MVNVVDKKGEPMTIKQQVEHWIETQHGSAGWQQKLVNLVEMLVEEAATEAIKSVTLKRLGTDINVATKQETQTESWEARIKQDYKGILSDEQIASTIAYWQGVIDQALTTERARVVELIEKEKTAMYPQTMDEDSAFGAWNFIRGLDKAISIIKNPPQGESEASNGCN